ncbi:dihydrofolate reductase family protein [Gordonia sp. zg691]|uniref:Dihydrofolate reductase family protein n=1 Tax=Gordonia jinghuaiqii TaxID=2758710 RepID=A0A7D7QGN5_9ACTN|nr:dihydrofolate reductase family protein [Gordonia jinghuaiqii]MBD0862910.1 dihydrofolate reductase family protein [Gordonia jinghuaiqii]MCR5978965.1 deaminase [Gordonia jinghuaiqii]QMT01702.1 dihydrofolate reductase family protein [Gordonia jinghuaiqii]
MGKIHVHEFITLDGSYEDPSFTVPYGFADGMAELLGAFMNDCTGILLGRRTFEMFGPAWSTRTADDDPGAPFFNDTTKYVVSSTLHKAEGWQNSEIFGTYDAEKIRALKKDRDLYVSGSGTLVRALLRDKLIDELHLLVYPVVLGSGARLFDGLTDTPLALVGSDVFDNGVVHLSYSSTD